MKMPKSVLRPSILNVPDIPPLLEQTLAAAQDNALEWIKIRVAIS